MIGDTSDAIWGVMDIFPITNFSDIRKKFILKSTSSMLVSIPREGGSLVRFYIELPPGTQTKNVKLSDLHKIVQDIFAPCKIDFADTFWWSTYSIGQRLADCFSKDNRVFLAGDACHTHSPKAGQGMNTSLQDGYNIGWKLALVLKGQGHPNLLKTYNIEREKIAADLIAFDRELVQVVQSEKPQEELADHYIKSARYTAGLTATYDDSLITKAEWSDQVLAGNLKAGMRFPSTQVVKFCDAKAMQLVKAFPADGRWRVLVFAGDILDDRAAERLKNVRAQTLFLITFTDFASWVTIFCRKMALFGPLLLEVRT